MKIFRYILLILIVCNIAGIVLDTFGSVYGSALSYFTFILMLIYYFLVSKEKIIYPLLIFGLLFFAISGLIFIPHEQDYLVDFFKFMVLIICGAEIARNTTPNELLAFHLIGALSILAHALFFVEDYGRYGGFFRDPNEAGFVCLLAFSLSFSVKRENIRIILICVFTFCGILTLSRTFLFIWLSLVIISLFNDWKNVKLFGIGIGVLAVLLSISYVFKLNAVRFSFVERVFEGGLESTNSTIRNARANVWSNYYQDIMSSPIFGNGYLSFAGIKGIKPGVHNSFLRVIGEAGILPFLLFIGIYFSLLMNSIKKFKLQPYILLTVVATIMFLMTNHTFSANKNIIFITIWAYTMCFTIETIGDQPTSVTLNSKPKIK